MITVGTQTFEFTTRDEDRACDLVQLPSGGGTALEIGRVSQTLFVKVHNSFQPRSFGCLNPILPGLQELP